MSNNWFILNAKLTYFMQLAIIIQNFYYQKGLRIPKNNVIIFHSCFRVNDDSTSTKLVFSDKSYQKTTINGEL
jgi:hypothetical protein